MALRAVATQQIVESWVHSSHHHVHLHCSTMHKLSSHNTPGVHLTTNNSWWQELESRFSSRFGVKSSHAEIIWDFMGPRQRGVPQWYLITHCVVPTRSAFSYAFSVWNQGQGSPYNQSARDLGNTNWCKVSYRFERDIDLVRLAKRSYHAFEAETISLLPCSQLLYFRDSFIVSCAGRTLYSWMHIYYGIF
jgi:hypothetical protein